MEVSYLQLSWRRFLRHRAALVGGVILALFCVMAIAAPILAGYDPNEMHPAHRLQGPSRMYPLGTDQFGRDTLSRIIYGARLSLRVSMLSTALALFMGTTLGLSAGYLGGATDMIISRILDILFAFPFMLLAIAIMAVLGPSEVNVILTIGVVYTPIFARICRGSVLSAKEREYVQAAKAIGARDVHIVLRHILPNVVAPLIVQTTLAVAMAIIAESALSFLGVGTPPPAPSWGSLLARGREVMSLSPWGAIFPGAAIVLTVLSLNLVGDGLRDALDPTLQ